MLLEALEDFTLQKNTQDTQHLIILRSAIAQTYIQKNRLASASKHLEQAHKILQSLGSDIDSRVNASYEYARSILEKANGNYSGFFYHSMLCLTYSNLKTMEQSEVDQLAYDIGLAVLVS